MANADSLKAMYKNRLQEYTQKSSIPLPIYHTINEGVAHHEPRFRSTVLVDGVSYTSHHVFPRRKAAEQDVARVALDGITQKIKEEGSPLIREDTAFCKSILNEYAVFCKSILNKYAVKMHMEKPTYNTIRSKGLPPVFASSLVFNGVTYAGVAGKYKKEAEQLAAQAVILSLLDTSDSRTVITEIIKSKVKLYEGDSTQSGINPPYIPATHQPYVPTAPIVSVPPALEQPLAVDSSSTTKRRKKAKRKSRVDA